MRIVLTGGGTGGHVTPFEPIVAAIRSIYPTLMPLLPSRVDPEKLSIRFFGIVDAETKIFFERLDVPTSHIPSGKVRQYISIVHFYDFFFRLPFGIAIAFLRLWRVMPDLVISKGGYGSIPVVLAAAFYRIPLLIHESDVQPGSANRLAARFATTVTVAFPATKKSWRKYQTKTVVTGIPVRASFGSQSQAEAKQELGLKTDRPVVAVIGGSQGAKQINELVMQLLPELISNAGVLHVTGPKQFAAVTAVAKESLATLTNADQYKAWPFVTEEMSTILSAADVVVSRAGATAIAELARLKKPALLLPLPANVSDNQMANASLLEAAGAARVLDAANVGANLLRHNLELLLTSEDLKNQLAQAISRFDYPAAAADIAEIAFTLAQGQAPIYARNES